MRYDSVIKGGNVVTPAGTFIGDVAVRGEQIVALGSELDGDGSRVIDARGHHVIPGVLDVHVHLELPFCGTVSADDYRSGTRAGARGGVTTVIDFAIPPANGSLSEAADLWMKKAEGKSLIDYTFHICITRWNDHKDQIKGMVERGFTTFKEFMIYESEGWQSDDRALFGTLEKMKEYGTMLLVHAESSRVLDDSVFDRPDGHLYACCPQLKKPQDSERLWRGLRTGEVSVISTDTCTFTREQKAMWEGDWTKIPMGMPGLETLMPLTYTHGVLTNRLTLEEMSAKLSTNPAKIMGLYPRKGAIQVGADADIAIIHPTTRQTVSPSTLETNADWSPYDGWDLAGFARTTLSRGEVIVDNYKVVGREGRGRWLSRTSAGLHASSSPSPASSPRPVRSAREPAVAV
ncbi:MAG TPA: amidohydrolase family protein [Gemmatimonadaceae bacterium]